LVLIDWLVDPHEDLRSRSSDFT